MIFIQKKVRLIGTDKKEVFYELKQSTTATEIYNVFNDSVDITASYIDFHFPDVPSCIYFATANWSGFNIDIGGTGDYTISKYELPLSPARAHQICNQQVDNGGGYIEIHYPNNTVTPTTPN